jgi:hypothetical protein
LGAVNKAANSKRINNPEFLRPREEGQELSCCARAILSGQADFKASRSQIEEIIEEAGHLVIFYPNFHSELNWIEYYWCACSAPLQLFFHRPQGGSSQSFEICIT